MAVDAALGGERLTVQYAMSAQFLRHCGEAVVREQLDIDSLHFPQTHAPHNLREV